ncbi:MAG: hypothetical protein ACE5R6_20715 [Candidatus Heimdallarchaeota archaeon]
MIRHVQIPLLSPKMIRKKRYLRTVAHNLHNYFIQAAWTQHFITLKINPRGRGSEAPEGVRDA